MSRNCVILQLDPLALQFGLPVENGNFFLFILGEGGLKLEARPGCFCPLWIPLGHMRGFRCEDSGVRTPPPPPPLKNHKIMGFLISYTGPDSLKNHKAANGASRTASETPLKWCFADGPMIAS